MAQEPYLSDQLLLTTLVVRLAVVALVAIVLVRYHRFRAILLTERRAWPERLVFTLSLGIPLTAAVASRLVLNYKAADLTLEGTFLAGLIAGPYAGAIVGFMVGLPPTFAHEWGALPFAVGLRLRRRRPARAVPEGGHLALLAVRLHRPAQARSGRWSAPLEVDWQIILVLAPISMEIIRLEVGRAGASAASSTCPTASPWMTLALIIATVLSVAIPIKIWNSARIEHRLEEQEKLLMAARIEALSSQINPHFLFNALNSISSLIRSNPETARLLIAKLSRLLRHRLKSRDHFVTLREELESIDQYLDIELVRFGPQLRVEKQIDAGHARGRGPEHDPAAADRELDQARARRRRSAAAP